MNFQVPQFIETEDRIIGPLTLRQFLYVATGGGLSFLLFFFLEFWLWLIVTFFIAVIFLSFAFIKINGRNFSVIAMAALGFYWRPRFYLWQRETPATAVPELAEIKIQAPAEEKGALLEGLWEQLKTSRQPVPKREKVVRPSILDRVRSSKAQFEMLRKITGERELARRVDYR